jgi:L-serine dehydratase
MISVFDIFKIGIGPSSSHTVGPMCAALSFLANLEKNGQFRSIRRIRVELFGSLASTGLGHATHTAIILGLSGKDPETINPGSIPEMLKKINQENSISLLGKHKIRFREEDDIRRNPGQQMAFHSNAMRFMAEDAFKVKLANTLYYSIGGGFVLSEDQIKSRESALESHTDVPFPFNSSEALLKLGQRHKLSIAEMALENEKMLQAEAAIYERLRKIADAMNACIEQGYQTEGTLPGGIGLKRRAPKLFKDLLASQEKSLRDPLTILDWISLWALAVGEENAAGRRVVTAPTNGAAGIVPAVLRYYQSFHAAASDSGIVSFLLTAGTIGSIYKMNASISGAEVGCQGEIGVACSMAAAGLTAALGGTNEQIENAAEIGMEHNLGLTCDPVAGLVQIPCIERNAMGAIKALNASRLALRGDGKHFVSLDKVIETMRQTGADMQDKYKETSKGGLAVNVVEC